MTLITKTNAKDLPEVLNLLTMVDLPVEGVKEQFQNFFIIRKDKTIVGCIGIEIYGNTALLRSLAVHPSFQGKGLGLQLVHKIEGYLTEKKSDSIYLLTETAENFFLNLGYSSIPRENVDPRIKQTIEFTTLCPASPVMIKKLSFL
ncbi:MAG: arsenic resistance N-acetyltransferase ArsN2 [Candidatus Hodarchaeales archaeon]|jgi:amino-acid N-acetyltransferase